MTQLLRDLRTGLGNPEPPTTIWQEPLDYDPAHLHRLCHIAQQPESISPDPRDLHTYAEDLSFVDEIQSDLFVFLLPVCLNALSHGLVRKSDLYAGFAEQFWVALNKRPGPLALLSNPQFETVDRYLRESILTSIDISRPLYNSGSGAQCYRWFYALGSYSTVIPSLDLLWTSWWNLSTEGCAIGALQYISCLLYEDEANPVFAPWTTGRGGGAPALWEDAMSVNEQPWHPDNIHFLRRALVPSQLFAAINRCRERLTDSADRHIATRLIEDFDRQRTLLDLRIEQLPVILSSNHYMTHKWTI
jgi:hypothetical protein